MQRTMEFWTGQTRADGANSWTGRLADGTDYGILDGAEWGGMADGAD